MRFQGGRSHRSRGPRAGSGFEAYSTRGKADDDDRVVSAEGRDGTVGRTGTFEERFQCRKPGCRNSTACGWYHDETIELEKHLHEEYLKSLEEKGLALHNRLHEEYIKRIKLRRTEQP